MAGAYYPEPLLRSPVELAAAMSHTAIAVLFFVNPPILNLPAFYEIPFSTALAALATFRYWQGLRLLRYQRRLSRSRHFTIPHVDSDPDRLFLGRGFRWQQRHVQRLTEARTEPARRYLKNQDAATGDPVLHGVGLYEREKKVCASLAERNGHLLVLGATRTGKTRLAELLISQDIHRGDTVIVLDPKGDYDLLRRIHHEAQRSGRAKDLRIVHLRYPELSQAYNPIASYHSPAEIASRIAGQLPGKGESAAFRDFAWRFINAIATAMDKLDQTPTYAKVTSYIENIEPLLVEYYERLFSSLRIPEWRRSAQSHADVVNPEKIAKSLRDCEPYTLALIQIYKKNKIKDTIADDLLANLRYDRVYYDKITASLRPLLDKLRSDRLAPILMPPAGGKDSISWPQAFAENSIVYVGLDALASPDIANAIGNAMFADIASAVGQLYAARGTGTPNRRVCIHADEFSRIVGPHLHPMLSMSGGAGVQITAYTQTMADIEAGVDGQRSHAERIVGNFNSVVMLRVRTADTARVLVEQIPMVEVAELVQTEAVADSSNPESDVAFTSSSSSRVATRKVSGLEPGDVMNLPKGEAFALLESGTWKLRIPLIKDAPEDLPIESILASAS